MKPAITTGLVRRLIADQFPQWRDLDVWPVAQPGNDNRTYHLGDHLLVRLPSDVGYAPQAERESAWLPVLAPHLAMPIPTPVAKGRPSAEYPYAFTVNRYLAGVPATRANVADLTQFARDVARFLVELQAIDATGGPAANAENCYRGASLAVYDAETQRALGDLTDELPTRILRLLWEDALDHPWPGPDVWVHGDIAPNNLLVLDGRLAGIIDFGIMAVGDPACDYAIAWTFLDPGGRQAFFTELGCDTASIARGRAWALWKALITYRSDEPGRADNAQDVIQGILQEVYDHPVAWDGQG